MKKKKTISVLLDLNGTSDYIDEQKATIFLKQLEILRKKFDADVATISISTHYDNTDRIKEVLKIIAYSLYNTCKLSDTIEIGISFYMDGIYDYINDNDEFKSWKFNEDKIATFDEYYLNNENYDNKWFAIIDDNISYKIYRKYKNIHHMLQIHPSSSLREVKKNNFMRIATMTDDFNGVIEVLDYYIDTIKDLDKEQILEKQKSILNYKEQLEEIKEYLKVTKVISNIELISLNCMIDEMYEEAKENNDIKNALKIKTLKRNLIVK